MAGTAHQHRRAAIRDSSTPITAKARARDAVAARLRGLDERQRALFCFHCFNKKMAGRHFGMEWLTGKSFSEAMIACRIS